ncbi:HAMP domain-containing protein [Pseudomonas protegens]|uniref:HAMP domain-containing protein n=1 Tax=Pseudomonas protegens TaxID=380021 RepID=UPI00387DBF3F
MLDDIAQGEGDLTRRLTSDRADELGSIAKGFNTFLAKLQAMSQLSSDLGSERQRFFGFLPQTSPLHQPGRA